LEEVNGLNRPLAEAKNLRFEIAAPDISALVYADSDKLRKILFNLISNAIKFTEQGGVTVSAGPDLSARRMVVQVQDTGVGIPVEVQSRLFQPFFQVDGSTTRRYGGTGLGLTISRRLAEMMGGTLTLYGAGAGQGTTLTLTLPLADTGNN
jgi:signal transduction histidine kinase